MKCYGFSGDSGETATQINNQITHKNFLVSHMIQNFIFQVLLVAFILFSATPLKAGLFDERFPSPRATAMGGAGVAVAQGLWSAYYNPAALSEIEQLEIGTSYLRLFNLTYLRNFFGGAVYPLQKYGAVSLNFQYFGVNYQNKNLSGEYTFSLSHGFYLINDIHTSLAFGYSLKFYHWSLGSSLTYGNLGNSTTFGMDVGFQASVYHRTYVGIYFLNINAPQVGTTVKHDLPQRIVAGIAYKPYDGVTTTLDFNRTIGVGDMQVWGGAEFTIFRNLQLRFGGTTNPNRFSAGIGIRFAQFKFDYAIITHNELGETHQIGFIISL